MTQEWLKTWLFFPREKSFLESFLSHFSWTLKSHFWASDNVISGSGICGPTASHKPFRDFLGISGAEGLVTLVYGGSNHTFGTEFEEGDAKKQKSVKKSDEGYGKELNRAIQVNRQTLKIEISVFIPFWNLGFYIWYLTFEEIWNQFFFSGNLQVSRIIPWKSPSFQEILKTQISSRITEKVKQLSGLFYGISGAFFVQYFVLEHTHTETHARAGTTKPYIINLLLTSTFFATSPTIYHQMIFSIAYKNTFWISPISGHVRPWQGTEICTFGRRLHWILWIFSVDTISPGLLCNLLWSDFRVEKKRWIYWIFSSGFFLSSPCTWPLHGRACRTCRTANLAADRYGFTKGRRWWMYTTSDKPGTFLSCPLNLVLPRPSDSYYWKCKYLMYCIFSCPEAPCLRETIMAPGLDL